MALEGSCEREWVTRMKSFADASCEKGNKINYLRTWNPMRPNTLRLTLIINCSGRASNIVAHVVKRLWLIGDSSPGVSLRESVSGRLVSVLEVPVHVPLVYLLMAARHYQENGTTGEWLANYLSLPIHWASIMLLKNRLQGSSTVHLTWYRCRMAEKGLIGECNLDKLKINHSTMRPSIFLLSKAFWIAI